jgi:hypothetical protein
MLGFLYAVVSLLLVLSKMWAIARRRQQDIGELIPLPRDLIPIVTAYLGVVRRCMKCNVVTNQLHTLAEMVDGERSSELVQVRLCARCNKYAYWRGARLFLSPITQYNVFPLLLRCVAYEFFFTPGEWSTFMFRLQVAVYLLMVVWFRALDPKKFDRGNHNIYHKIFSLPGVILSNLLLGLALFYGYGRFWAVFEGLVSFLAIPDYLRKVYGPKSFHFFSQVQMPDEEDEADRRQRQILLSSEQRMQVGGFYGF